MSKKHLTLSNFPERNVSRAFLLRVGLFLLLIGLVCAVPVEGQSVDRSKLLEEIIALQNKIKNTTDPAELAALGEQLKNKEELFLAPAPEDFTAFADWVKQPYAGLIRILPRERFDGVLSIRGGGAYYSFVSQEHAYGFGSELSLELENLKVGFAGADFGFLVSLGPTPVESVRLDTPGVASMASFNPPLDEAGAREQYQRASVGFQENGFFYRSRLPVSIGTTFALRSVSYEDADVLVVFRVIRRDTDGSLIIAWKVLKRYPTPQLNGMTLATTSAASFAQSTFARDTIAVAFGKDMSGGDYVAMTTPLPTRLGDVFVTVQDKRGNPYAPLFAVTPAQVNFLIPSQAVEGYGLITVFTSSGKRLTELVRIAKIAPGLFSANADGQGVPAAVARRIRNGAQSYESIARFDGAQNKFVPLPIDLGGASDQVILLLFGTGIRGRTSLDRVSVKIGGIAAKV